MKVLNYLGLALIGLFAACSSKSSKEKIDIYVTPFYNSTPLQINIGKYSERLMSESPKQMLKLADEIKGCIDEVDAATLYVLAIRLYNLGKKDDAVYWFYNAQFRKRIFLHMAIGLSPSGAPAALDAFQKLSGQWINGYAFGHPDKLIAVLEQIIIDVQHMRYIEKAYPDYDFKPESEQVKEVGLQIEGLREMIKYIDENRDEIKQKRKENGVEGKY